jgi:uncharacterized repeat protein (TIGR01451 family)
MRIRLATHAVRLAAFAALALAVLVGSGTGAAWATGGRPSGGTVPKRLADVTVHKAGSLSGNKVTFTITVRNKGPNAAKDVVLIDAIPPQLSFVSMQRSGVAANCGRSGRTITCRVSDLLWADESSFLRLTVVTQIANSSARQVVNTALVFTSTPDPKPSNNVDHVTVRLR